MHAHMRAHVWVPVRGCMDACVDGCVCVWMHGCMVGAPLYSSLLSVARLTRKVGMIDALAGHGMAEYKQMGWAPSTVRAAYRDIYREIA